MSCTLDGIPVQALWDTGAQVSMVSKTWLRESLLSSKSRNLEELLGDEAQLKLVGANGGAIPFEGWIKVVFQLGSDTQSSLPLMVPFLVAKDDLEHPIIGYNVIEEVIKTPTQKESEDTGPLEAILGTALGEVKRDDVTALVHLVRTTDVEKLCVVMSGKDNLRVPHGQTVTVSCRVDCGPLEERTPVLFEPTPEPTWPSGLQLFEQLLSLPLGIT